MARTVQFRQVTVSVAVHRAPEELRLEAHQAFSDFVANRRPPEKLPIYDRQDRESIVAFLDEIERCVAEDDGEELRDLIDFDRLARRIELTGNLRGWSSFERRALKTEIKKSVSVDPFWSKPILADVVACLEPTAGLDPIRLRVKKIDRSYGLKFHGELETSSELVPEFREGLPMEFGLHEVKAFRVNDEPPVLRP